MIQKNCPTCGDPIAPAKDVAQFNRNLALHNRSKHGYKSPNFKKNKDYKARAMAGNSYESLARTKHLHWTQMPENKEKLAANQRKAWEARRIGLAESAIPAKRKYTKHAQSQTSEVVPCRLDTCPVCSARFYVARGSA
jgi:hypothetical protein